MKFGIFLELSVGRPWTGGDEKRVYDESIEQVQVAEQLGFDQVWVPERNGIPKPLQDPHPPLWVAINAPGTELDAADRGLGHLGLAFGSYESLEARFAEYRRRIQLCEPVGSFVNECVATVNFLHCHEDDERGREQGRRMMETFQLQSGQAV